MAKLLYLGNSDPMGLKLSISDEEMSRILSIYDKKKKKEFADQINNAEKVKGNLTSQ